jgi:hypothetical protein
VIERRLQSPSPDRAPHKRERIENFSSLESGFTGYVIRIPE